MKVLHGFGDDQWLLWVVQNMCQCVHPDLVVRGVDTHCLLSHGALIGVSGRLIVIWKRNNGSTDTQNHRWMDFTVSILVSL